MAKKSKSIDWQLTKVDLIAHFRCGGTARIIEYDRQGSEHYPHRIRIGGFHLVNEFWTYNDNGEHGESTGPENEVRPFEIVKIQKVPA